MPVPLATIEPQLIQLAQKTLPGVKFETARKIKVNGQDRCKVAIQTNNLDVDDRGYVYSVDRANAGMHIMELTGSARAIARFPAN